MFLDFSKNVIKAKSVPRSRIRSPFRLQNQRSIKWNQRQLQSTMEIFEKRKLHLDLPCRLGLLPGRLRRRALRPPPDAAAPLLPPVSGSASRARRAPGFSPARPAFHARHLAGPPAAPADQIYRHHLTHLAPRLQLRGSDLPWASQTAGAPDFPAAAARVHGLAPCAREREVATARASRDAELPPHLQRPSRSPDVGGDVGCPVGAYPGRTVHGMWGEGAVFGVPLEVALGA